MNRETSKKTIELILYTPKRPIQIVNVKLGSKIEVLNPMYGNTEHIFIYNGIELSTLRTFGSYGLSNQDLIIIIPKQAKQIDYIQRWLNYTSESDEFAHKIRNMINPKTALEAARVNDIYISKLERKPKIFSEILY